MMPLMENSKLWLALAGSCKLQGCVPAHLITCSPAQSLPSPCSQHVAEEKGHLLMSFGSKSCLWGSSETWKMQLRVNWSHWKSSTFLWIYCSKCLEKTEFAPTLTFPEANQLSWCQGSSEGMYDTASKINQWRNDVNIGGREKAQRLEEEKSCKTLKNTLAVTEKKLGLGKH